MFLDCLSFESSKAAQGTNGSKREDLLLWRSEWETLMDSIVSLMGNFHTLYFGTFGNTKVQNNQGSKCSLSEWPFYAGSSHRKSPRDSVEEVVLLCCYCFSSLLCRRCWWVTLTGTLILNKYWNCILVGSYCLHNWIITGGCYTLNNSAFTVYVGI